MDLQPINNLNNINLAPENLKAVLNKQGDVQQKKAAEDFESFFIQMSLKEMRPKLEGGIFNDGLSQDVFYQFLDEAIAKEIAKSPNNFGIAESVNKEMTLLKGDRSQTPDGNE